MKLAVYCASADGSSAPCRDAAERLGTWIGQNGHTLVYGGAREGLMGIVADAALAAGGEVTGVLPDVEEILARSHRGLTRVLYTKDMAERKNTMIALSDACVALPGGPGTLDEISDILSLMRLGLYDKPCALYSVNGYWAPLADLLQRMEQTGFLQSGALPGLLISDRLEEITAHVTGTGG